MPQAQTHVDPPKEVQEYLAKYGGKNPYGEPMFRLVWGGSRLAWRGGRFDILDETTGQIVSSTMEYRETLKYPQTDRFHIEIWRPPEYWGTQEQWEQATRTVIDGMTFDSLGEYPARGEYDSLDVVEQLGVCHCGIDLEMRDKLFKIRPRANAEIVPCDTCGRNSIGIWPTRTYVKKLVDCYHESQGLSRETVEVWIKNKAEQEEARNDRLMMAMFDEATGPEFLRPMVALGGHEFPRAEKRN